MNPKEEKTFSIVLTVSEINQVLAVLQDKPYNQVNTLIQNILGQANAQALSGPTNAE